MDSSDHGKESFLRQRDQRIAARDSLAITPRKLHDTYLTQILYGILARVGCSPCQGIPTRKIISLLNKGATASLFDPHELNGPNLGDLVDALEEHPTFTTRHRIFKLLDNIIASPCDSWATNRRYVGNGGQTLPYFLMSVVVTGDVWGSLMSNTSQSMFDRFRAWCTLRKMIWAYEHDLAAGRLHPSRKGFVERLFEDFLLHVSRKEKTCIFDDVESRLFDSVVKFFRKRSMSPPSGVHPNCYTTLLGPFATQRLLRVNGQLFQTRCESLRVKQVLNKFFMNKQARRMTLKLLAYQEFRTWILCEDGIRELCRRKERVLFKELYVRDPQSLIEIIPFALMFLESKFVRGCKTKLMGFLCDVLVQEVGNEEMWSNQVSGSMTVGNLITQGGAKPVGHSACEDHRMEPD